MAWVVLASQLRGHRHIRSPFASNAGKMQSHKANGRPDVAMAC